MSLTVSLPLRPDVEADRWLTPRMTDRLQGFAPPGEQDMVGYSCQDTSAHVGI